MEAYSKPLPQPSALSLPFWEGAKHSEIRVQKCRACGHMEHPPRPLCTACWSPDLEWVSCGLDGEVYSYTVCHWATMKEYKNDTPYIIAIVQLSGGVRLTTNIVGCDPDRISVGLKVKAVFEKVADQFTLIKFRPA
ncbi:Zn-ribbon domain-containing OB-fold protein [Bradyrhizobium erythrophlei]|uniref:Zn-ribbon domain-containing OB-fold protein n=1 Tax=Bradyrhizobium erythrophlei TaxID=1437360 RepID=UPI0035E8BB41